MSTIFSSDDAGSTGTCVRIGWFKVLEVYVGRALFGPYCVSTIFSSDDAGSTGTCWPHRLVLSVGCSAGELCPCTVV